MTRIFLIVLCLMTASCKKLETQTVTVFAASSLQDVLEEIAQEWSRRSGESVRFRFDASSALARQINEGASADIFISADKEWADHVKAADRFEWVGNRLVCVVRKDAISLELSKMQSLVLGGEDVPVGKYARAALKNMGIKIPARCVQGSNARDVLSKVFEGAAEAGIVYATDVSMNPNLRASFLFPEKSHPRISYTVALIHAKSNDFFSSLRQKWALDIAVKRGYVVYP